MCFIKSMCVCLRMPVGTLKTSHGSQQWRRFVMDTVMKSLSTQTDRHCRISSKRLSYPKLLVIHTHTSLLSHSSSVFPQLFLCQIQKQKRHTLTQQTMSFSFAAQHLWSWCGIPCPTNSRPVSLTSVTD